MAIQLDEDYGACYAQVQAHRPDPGVRDPASLAQASLPSYTTLSKGMEHSPSRLADGHQCSAGVLPQPCNLHHGKKHAQRVACHNSQSFACHNSALCVQLVSHTCHRN